MLIEVDPLNTTKPAVGQYVLLNELCPHGASRTMFLIVHFWRKHHDPGSCG
jgi:hypothetical protein